MTAEDNLADFKTPKHAPYIWIEEKKIDDWEADMDEEVAYSLDNGMESEE